jgi:SAM-dependent methyltransferase
VPGKPPDPSLTGASAVAAEYAGTGRLETRIGFYERFSSDQPWGHWLHRRVVDAPGLQVADVGCGPGRIWLDYGAPATGHVVLIDKFPAMIEAARQALAGRAGFDFVVADAADDWAPQQRFDVILAAHVIYHLSDKSRVIQAARRRLLPGGRLYLSFPALDHLKEIRSLLQSVGIDQPADLVGLTEQVHAIVAEEFGSVATDIYTATLHVDDAGALYDFVRSFRPLHGGALDDPVIAERFRAAAQEQVASGLAAGSGFVVTSRNRLICGRI